MSDPVVLWPAPGLPALLTSSEPGFEIVLAVEGADASLAAWAADLVLGDHGLRACLVAEEPRFVSRDGVGPLARRAAALPRFDGHAFARISLRLVDPVALAPAAPRTVRVLDLVHDDAVIRPRSVAVRAPRAGRLDVMFGTDLHVGALWDDIGAAVAAHAPDIAGEVLHPDRLLERFIAVANARAARGELDLIILGGDLVDHVFARPREELEANGPFGLDDTNLPRLLGILAAATVPVLAIPGNHDHRLYPWRPRLYGLESVGVPAARVKEILVGAGAWDPWPVRAADWDALRTEEADGVRALEHHLVHLAPATDGAVCIDGLRIVLLSTGRDILPRWREVEAPRRGLLLRSLRSSWHDPDSEGLTDAQVALVRPPDREPAPAGSLVVLHAPLLHPPHEVSVQDRLGSIDPGPRDDLGARVRFEKRLFRSGLRRGVFFRNPGTFLRAIADTPGPVASFSGHVHQPHATAFDRDAWRVRSIALGEAADRPPADAILLGAAAVGQTGDHGRVRPGYLTARFEDGRLESVRSESILEDDRGQESEGEGGSP